MADISHGFFFGAILNALIMYAMFSVPYSLEENSLKLYVAVTYLLCGETYTLYDIPFWSNRFYTF
ncbi:MAG: hypothetical protein MSH22_09835 [Spirochaetia bacterium]|nr:hypothetical protein [Spirochaetia bacterium]